MPKRGLLKAPWAQQYNNSYGFVKTRVRDRVAFRALFFVLLADFVDSECLFGDHWIWTGFPKSTLERVTAPTKPEVESARLRKACHTFRPRRSKRTFLTTQFDVWFRDYPVASQFVAPSQWSRLQDEWPFLKRYTYDDAQRAALHLYLQDPRKWGIGWETLKRIQAEAMRLKADDATPYEKLSMWHKT